MENKGKSDKDLQGELKKYSELMDQVERDFQMGRIKDEARDELKSGTQRKIEEIQMVLDGRRGGKKIKEKKIPEKTRENLLKEVEAVESKTEGKEKGKMEKLKEKLLKMGKK